MNTNPIRGFPVGARRSGFIPDISGVKPKPQHEIHKTPFVWLFVWCLLGTMTLNTYAASELQTFTRESFQTIRRANTGHPLVIAFWSIHCEPCKAELALLAQLHREFPAVKIALVATDAPDERSAVLRFLSKYQLGEIAVSQFNDEAEERIRYSVDPAWRGELPRSYFFDQRDGVTKQSGVPEEAQIRRWFKQVTQRSGH